MTAVFPVPTRPSPIGTRASVGSRLLEYVRTTDHKQIGQLYLVTPFGFFMVGGEERVKVSRTPAHGSGLDCEDRDNFPPDAERFAQGLEDDRKLTRAKLVAGVATELALAGMLITSLQEPGHETAILLAVIMTVLALTIIVRMSRLRQKRGIPKWELSQKSSNAQTTEGSQTPQQQQGRLVH